MPPEKKLSASSWGCELKYDAAAKANKLSPCQPLREAVSWNTKPRFMLIWSFVSLFVRLWVEICSSSSICMKFSSASSWGCELKSIYGALLETESLVSLFVRLWVEMYQTINFDYLSEVSLFVRLWVEIRIMEQLLIGVIVSLFVRLWVEMLNATGT